jgi:hypothetical protein
MTIEFKGVIEKEDEFEIKEALKHYKERLLYFKENELAKRLGLVDKVNRDIDFELHQIEELLKYMLPDREYFGFDKHEKLGVYSTVIASALRQFVSDLIEMNRHIKSEFAESDMRSANIEDALDEVERILTKYSVFRVRGQIKIEP